MKFWQLGLELRFKWQYVVPIGFNEGKNGVSTFLGVSYLILYLMQCMQTIVDEFEFQLHPTTD